MADEPRRRMSRSISLVLLAPLPGLAGCGGDEPRATQEMEVVEDKTVEPPPDGPEHLAGGPFVAWWGLAHPPTVVHRMVPRSTLASSGYTRTGSGIYHRSYYGGRSGFLSSPSYSPGPSHTGPVSRGGFGTTGHATAGG